MASNFLHVLQIVAPAFLIIALGYGWGRYSAIGNNALTQISMSLLVPAFAWEHLHGMNLQGGILIDVLLSSVIIMLIPGGIAWLIFRRIGISQRGIYLPIMFMNSVNLPFPILVAAYGPDSLPFAMMFYLTAFLGVFTIGLLIVANGKNRGYAPIFKEPVIYVVAGALLTNRWEIQLPEFANQMVHLLAQATIPMVLLTLGIQMSKVRVSSQRLSFMAVSIRFLGGGLAGILCVWLFKLEGLAYKVVIVEALMPCAVINSLIAEKYRAQTDIIASTILISTILSLLIIPMILLVLG